MTTSLLWDIVDTGVNTAEENMAWDAARLEALTPDEAPILHLYDWQGDCGTYGYFVDPADYLDMQGVARKKLKLARRPTGGGIVFHVCDFAFSVLLPAEHPSFSLNTLDNYAVINRAVIRAVERFKQGEATLLPDQPAALDQHSSNFCMAKPTQYDVMIGSRKVGGAAQRRRKQGLLHQGSIAIAALSDEYLNEILAPNTRVLEAMRANTFSLLGPDWTAAQLKEARADMRELLRQEISKIA